MTAIATHTSLMTGRQLRALARQPAYLVISLIQPVIWLFLFGSLFRKIVELPGFGTASYLDYLVPGVVIMSALSTSMWSGMTVLEEIDRGIMDRFLVLPLHRSAIINASVIMQSLMTTVQSVIIVALGWAAGAHYPGGVAGVAGPDRRVGADRASCSARSRTRVGMLARQRETIIGINTFLLLPLTFLSTRVHGHRADAALDADRRRRQPGQLGAGGGPGGDERGPGLEPGARLGRRPGAAGRRASPPCRC